MDYSGERFHRNFADFEKRYGIQDMYSGGFYPFPTAEEFWAWWSRQIMLNRYDAPAGEPYLDLHKILDGKNYFVITTNVDHQFQKAGFDKKRLFYTQGDYGLWQCSVPCHSQTYDNEQVVREMYQQQAGMKIPADLIPHCPKCGEPMTMNLRCDQTFVEDRDWHEAAARYQHFLEENRGKKVLFLELGVGGNTPSIIKYPFWQMTAENPKAHFVSINQEQSFCPARIAGQSLCIQADLADALEKLAK